MKKFIFCSFFLLVVSSTYAQNLGRGINLGNMFEAPSEAAWGNPFQEEYIAQIAGLGFQHIRVPIRWDVPERAQSTSPYTLNSVFLARIKSVVDLAIRNNLYVIINMHHHEDLFNMPVDAKPRFLSQWQQIASYFRGYDDHLLFEVLNEPHGNLTPSIWNEYFHQALVEIRKTNPTRKVLLGTASYGGTGGVRDLNPPADPNLILSVHYYNPFNFTHQGADWAGNKDKYIGTKWDDLFWERKQIMEDFDYAIQWAKEKKMLFHVGEFGSYELADMESRVRWTNFIARWLETQGASWAYWEYSAGFGIYNPQSKTFKAPLVDALLKTPLSSPKVLPTKNLFALNGQSGWSLNLNSGAGAILTSSASGLQVAMTNVTGTNWHIQLNRGGFLLSYKRRYVVNIKALADKTLPITAYVGRSSSPYSAYSGYNELNLEEQEKEFTFVFMMNEPFDSNARLVFDMGSKVGNVQINSIRIDEIIEEVPLGTQENVNKSHVYPNPFNQFVYIESTGTKNARLMDSQGRIYQTIQFSDKASLESNTLLSGTYILQITTPLNGDSETHLLLKLH